jgi:hypothetical protein
LRFSYYSRRPYWAVAQWGIVGFGQVFENFRISPHFCALFPKYKLCINFGKKISWATFWAIFSKSHLVTLGLADPRRKKTLHKYINLKIPDSSRQIEVIGSIEATKVGGGIIAKIFDGSNFKSFVCFSASSGVPHGERLFCSKVAI